MSIDRIGLALSRAANPAGHVPLGPTTSTERRLRVAIGDPQAPIETFFAHLDRHGLLGGDGWLASHVELVSVGDHFDWGKAPDRARAAESALCLLAWLTAHPPEQVTVLIGNHDLGRVGELVRYDDDRFARAQRLADVAYRDGVVDRDLERAWLADNPDLPSVEIVARDFSSFTERQRLLVTKLLRARRFRLARAFATDLLVCHAGVTDQDLALCGLDVGARRDAHAIDAALDSVLQRAVDAWDGSAPLMLAHLHRPGDATYGEGRGILYHRPSDAARDAAYLFEGPPRRRFDPRGLPRGITQVIGHIRDDKCRKLLAAHTDGAVARDGPLRTLVTDGTKIRYAHGTTLLESRGDAGASGAIVFVDGGMRHAPLEDYELFDLDTRRALRQDGAPT